MSSEVSPGTRLKVWWEGVTAITRVVFAACMAIYAFNLLTGFDDLGLICLMPAPVLERFQVYRLLTSALFHVGVLHLAFNMLAFVPIGVSLERHLGSVQFAWLIALLCLLGDAAYIAIAYLGRFAPISYARGFWHQCAVGFSGVVFGLIVVDNHVSGVTTRSVFGFFSVPAKVYPYALLVFWQILVPQASFLGHLAGVLVGQLYAWGWLRWAMLGPAALSRAERSVLFAPCYHRSGFIVHSGAGSGHDHTQQLLPLSSRPERGGGGGAARAGSGWLRGVWMPFPANLNPLQPQAQLQPLPQQAPRQQPGAGYTTGGAGPGQGAVAGAPPVDPKAAAAAAAEARLARAAGSASAPSLSSLKK